MRNEFEFAKIYVLTDYENKPFYVGCTVQELSARLGAHLSEAKKNYTYTNVIKNKKIRSLNFQVRIKAVFIIPANMSQYGPRRMVWSIETLWIKKMLSEGFELCNSKKEANRTVAIF